MTPQELKNSILLLAVNGRLVPQSKTDESAIVLIDKIRCEQKRLLSDGIIKREKYNSDIDSVEDLPDGWCYAKLGELTKIVTKQTGFDYSKTIKPNLSEVKQSGMIPMVQTKNFKGTQFDFDTDYYIPVEIAKQFPKIMLDTKCMLLSIVGASIGNIGIYPGQPLAMIGGAICKVTLIDDKLYDYLYYFLQSPLGQQEIKKNLKATAQGTITVQDVREILIKIPPIAEQKRIVARIEELLPLIDRYEKAWNQLEDFNKRFPGDMQKSILQMAIQGKLVEQRPEEGTGEELYHQIQREKQALIKAGKIKNEKPLSEITEDEIPFDIPESWKWVRLSRLASVIVDCPHSTPHYYENSTGYVAIDTNCIDAAGNITGWRYVDKETYLERIMRLQPLPDDIVYTREGSICRAAILPPNEKVCLGQRVMLIRCPNGVLVDYLKMILMAPQTVSALTAKQKGIGAKHVNVADVCNLVLPLPPTAEQKRIIAKLGLLLPLCRRLK